MVFKRGSRTGSLRTGCGEETWTPRVGEDEVP